MTAPAIPVPHQRCGARADPVPRVSKPIGAKRIALESNLCSNDGMRWNGQQVGDHSVGAAQTLPGLDGLLRTVRTPEFAGMFVDMPPGITTVTWTRVPRHSA